MEAFTDMKKKWSVTFYRNKDKTDKIQSCIVWGKSASEAIEFCKNYFHLDGSITLDVEEE